jgi:DNA-binding CsgD family transcriptional regulator
MEDWNGIAKLAGFANEHDMLVAFYVVDRLSVQEIARRLHCGPATVARRLAVHLVSKRPRGGANNSHQLGKLLFRMDQRKVFSTPNSSLANELRCHESTVYKYKRSVTTL